MHGYYYFPKLVHFSRPLNVGLRNFMDTVRGSTSSVYKNACARTLMVFAQLWTFAVTPLILCRESLSLNTRETSKFSAPENPDHIQYSASKHYTRCLISNPLFAIRAARRISEPPISADPPNIWAYRKPPSCRPMRAPAIGDPVRQAINTTEKHMPVRIPILFRSGVRLAQAAGNRLCTPAAKNP